MVACLTQIRLRLARGVSNLWVRTNWGAGYNHRKATRNRLPFRKGLIYVTPQSPKKHGDDPRQGVWSCKSGGGERQ